MLHLPPPGWGWLELRSEHRSELGGRVGARGVGTCFSRVASHGHLCQGRAGSIPPVTVQ